MNEKRDGSNHASGPQADERHPDGIGTGSGTRMKSGQAPARRHEGGGSETPNGGAAAGEAPAAGGEPDVRAQIIEKLHTVFDPEIPVDIYELGLIYEIDVKPSGDVHITMTLTSPACPSAQELPMAVRGAASVVPAVKDVEVDVVFDPPWSPEKMSEDARLALGMM